MTKSKSLYRGRRFRPDDFNGAARWHFHFQLSLRDIEELLIWRGITMT